MNNLQCGSSRNYIRYNVTLQGTKGYGIDYGVCNGVNDCSEIATEGNLGQVTLELLKQGSKEWEDSVVYIRPVNNKGELSQ